MTNEPWVLTREMFLSEAEVDTLLDDLERRIAQATGEAKNAAVVDRLIAQSLLYSGLRNSEFCRMRVADTIVGTGESIFLVVGTPRQDRTVHVPEFVSQNVKQFVREVRPQLVASGTDPRDLKQPLILNERGRPYERTGLYRRVVRILSDVGLAERASVQLLRHTYGYLGYKRTGGNLLFLQRQLGHAHPMVTSVYAEFADEDYGVLANVVAGSVAGDKRRSRRVRTGTTQRKRSLRK